MRKIAPRPANQARSLIRAYRLTLQLDADTLSDMASALRLPRADRANSPEACLAVLTAGYLRALHDLAQTHRNLFPTSARVPGAQEGREGAA